MNRRTPIEWKLRSDAHESLYWLHDVHLNIRGNRLARLLISRDLIERPFLEVPDKSQRLSGIGQLLNTEIDVALVE